VWVGVRVNTEVAGLIVAVAGELLESGAGMVVGIIVAIIGVAATVRDGVLVFVGGVAAVDVGAGESVGGWVSLGVAGRVDVGDKGSAAVAGSVEVIGCVVQEQGHGHEDDGAEVALLLGGTNMDAAPRNANAINPDMKVICARRACFLASRLRRLRRYLARSVLRTRVLKTYSIPPDISSRA
jgi:hypothetical protein